MLLPSYNVIAPEANNTKQIMILLHMKFGDISIKYVIKAFNWNRNKTYTILYQFGCISF
jgi:hypothetical protein